MDRQNVFVFIVVVVVLAVRLTRLNCEIEVRVLAQWVAAFSPSAFTEFNLEHIIMLYLL